MANKYCNLYGQNKIKDEYDKINQGFASVEQDVNTINGQINEGFDEVQEEQDAQNTKMQNHIAGTADKHKAEDVNYTGNVPNATNLKEGLDNLHNRVEQIITTPIEGASAQEIIDARKGKTTLRAKIDEVDSQLADITNNQGDIGQLNTTDKSSVVNAIKEIKSQANANASAIDGIGNLKLIGAYATLLDLETAYPTGTNGIALVTADGYGYYWSGSAWTQAAEFQSTGIADKSVTYRKTDFLEYELKTFVPVNVYDKDNLSELGYYCDPANGQFVTNEYTTNYYHTNYIPVRAGVRYLRKYFRSFVFFDDGKTFVSGSATPPASSLTLNGVTGYVVEIPEGCSYAVLNITATEKDDEYLYMAEEDLSNPTQYTLKMPLLNIKDNTDYLQMKGKTVVCFGDSITEYNNYQPHITALTGATVINCGFGGCNMSKHQTPDYDKFSMTQIADAIYAEDFSAQDAANANLIANYGDSNTIPLNNLKSIDWNIIDYVTIFYGTNDFSWNIPIGTVDSGSRDYFAYSIKYVIEKLLLKYPHLKIAFITPIYRWTYSQGNDTDITPNPSGKYLRDYCECIVDVAHSKYHLPVLNLYDNCNINKINHVTMLSDGIHPTTLGYKVIGDKIGKFLMSS